MVAKAGLGLIGLGAIGVGGVALAKPAWFGISNEMPTFKTLASSTTLSGKWVNDFRIYFVDSTGNDSWFDWVFKNRYKGNEQNNKTKFVGITSGKGTETSLAKACKEAYEAVTSKVKTTASAATANDDFAEENIWKYCSVGGTKLKTVSEGKDKDSYSTKLGKTHETDLLSVEESDNDWAWHIKQKKFLSDDVPTEEGVFKQFHKDNVSHKDEEKGLRLRDECKKRYNDDAKTGSETNTSTTLTADALKKYCSLKVDGSNA